MNHATVTQLQAGQVLLARSHLTQTTMEIQGIQDTATQQSLLQSLGTVVQSKQDDAAKREGHEILPNISESSESWGVQKQKAQESGAKQKSPTLSGISRSQVVGKKLNFKIPLSQVRLIIYLNSHLHRQ